MLSFDHAGRPNVPECPEPSLLDCTRAQLPRCRPCSGIGDRRDASGKSPFPALSENNLSSFSISCFCSPVPKFGRNGLRAVTRPLPDRCRYPTIGAVNAHANAAILLGIIVSAVAEQSLAAAERTMSKLNADLLFLNLPCDLLKRNKMLAHDAPISGLRLVMQISLNSEKFLLCARLYVGLRNIPRFRKKL